MTDARHKHRAANTRWTEEDDRRLASEAARGRTVEELAHLRNRHCPALIAGQRNAERLGQRTHEPEMVTYATARASGRSPCLYCFPQR